MLKNWFKHEGTTVKLLLSLALLIYFIFGFYHLSNFITADEHFWLPNTSFERIETYWSAIKHGKWKNTQINDKPGITLAYTSGIAMLFDNAKEQIITSNNTYKIYNPQRTKEINFLYRLPILILSGLFSFFFFWIIKKITRDRWIALFSAIGILLSPILLGISQIVNPDSLFWIFGTASLLSFYAFLQHQEKKLAFFASLFLGLGLASKYVSVIFFPFFFFMILAFYFFEYPVLKDNPKKLQNRILRSAVAYFLILAGGLLFFAIMMPASIVNPKILYSSTIGFPGMKNIFLTIILSNLLIIGDAFFWRSEGLIFLFKKLSILRKFLPKIVYFFLADVFIFVLINWLTKQGLYDFSSIDFDTKQKDYFSRLPYLIRFISEFVPLVFSLTPIALFSLIYIWIRSIFMDSKNHTFTFILSAFFLIFYAAVVQQGLLVTVRYSIILFPLAMILTAIAIKEFFNPDEHKSHKKYLFIFLFIAVTIFFFYFSSLFLTVYGKAHIGKTFLYYANKFYISAPFVTICIAAASWIMFRFISWQKIKAIPFLVISIIFILVSVINIWLIKPFYFSYTNNFLPKQYIISGAWGYGGYEAAQYLNSQPNAENLTVWTDAYGVCEFFVGKCIHKSKVNTSKYTINYYFRSLQATLPLNFPHPMEKNSIWSMQIDSRPKSFIRIYKALPSNSPVDINDDSND